MGPYEIVSSVGAGGMGEVYRARDTRLERDVAVKVLPAALADDSDRLQRFEQEARTIAALNHPNILGIFDVGVQGETHYLVSELLEGETLRQKIQAGPLSQRRALEYATQIAGGLAAAHAKGIIHRDLKPENIFIMRTGRVKILKILDFGLAKAVPTVAASAAGSVATLDVAVTMPGVVMGTAGYMSPEQVRGERVDHRTDFFSFGAVLYEMVSGQRAFQRPSGIETMNAILKEDPPEISHASVSPGMERIIRRCLEKAPERRFQSASDLAFAVETLTATGTASAGAPVIAPPKRQYLIAVAAVAELALLAGAFWIGLRSAGTRAPTFRQLASGPGMISSARFTPDGQNVVYGASWRGKPFELFTTRLDSIESRSLGLPPADIAGISNAGDMLVMLGWHSQFQWTMTGTLARAPLSGGAPRPLLEDVCGGDIDAAGKEVAAVRCGGSQKTLEFPLGHAVYRTTGWMDQVRFAPDGDAVAFLDHPVLGDDRGFVSFVDRQGKVTHLTTDWSAIKGLAWRDAQEIWFSGSGAGETQAFWGVTRSGRRRKVLEVPTDLRVQDNAANGKTLLLQVRQSNDIAVRRPGQTSDQIIELAETGSLAGMSDNGSLLALSYVGVGAGSDYLTYIANTDTHETIRLGEGDPSGISPDGKWVMAFFPSTPGRVVLYPTGPGEARTFQLSAMRTVSIFCSWTQDSSKLAFTGSDGGQPTRGYLLDVGSGQWRTITPEGTTSVMLAPNGKLAVGKTEQGGFELFPVDGGQSTPAKGISSSEEPVQWDGSSRHVYVWDRRFPARIFLVDPWTGERKKFLETMPPDPSGVLYGNFYITPDGKTYAYRFRRVLSTLFAADGLK